MITVRLYGAMGEAFGRVWRLDVRTPAEAIRALGVIVPGFRRWLLEHRQTPFRVLVDTTPRGAEDLALPTAARTFRFVPLVSGAGRGLGQIVLGVALIWASGGFASWGLAGLGTGFGAGATFGWSVVGSIGVSLALGGVAQMLSKPPKGAESVERPENKPSYAFDGAVNTAAQGNPVPVCYGQLIVGSQVISAGLVTEQVAA